MLVYTFFFFFFNLLHYKVTPINTGNLVCSLRSSSIKGFLLFSSCSKHSRWIFTHCLQWCSNLTLPGILVIVVTMTGDHPWHFRMPKILQCLKQCPVQWGIFLSPIPIMLPSKNPGLESLRDGDVGGCLRLRRVAWDEVNAGCRWAAFLPGGARGRSTSRLTQVVGWNPFFVVVELRSLCPCCYQLGACLCYSMIQIFSCFLSDHLQEQKAEFLLCFESLWLLLAQLSSSSWREFSALEGFVIRLGHLGNPGYLHCFLKSVAFILWAKSPVLFNIKRYRFQGWGHGHLW